MSQAAINMMKRAEIEEARRLGGDAAANKVAERHMKEAFNPVKYGAMGAKAGGLIGGPGGAAIGGLIGAVYGFLKMEP